MATIVELEAAYEAVTRVTPSAAQKLILSDLATASQNGVISDDQAYAHILKQADGTTTVAALTYQFFTGKLPTEAGFDYLVSSTANTSDLNDAYFQGFNFENRFINFAVSLGVHGEGKTAFQTKYGALSMRETAEVLYNQIIGVAQAQAAGIDVEAAIGGIVARANYFASIVYPPAAPGAPTPIHDGLAVKAAMAGYIMAEAVKAKVGVYSNGISNFYRAVIDGEADFHTDLNDYVTSGGGSGGPGIPGNTLILDFDTSYDVTTGEFTDHDDVATGKFGPSALGDTFLNTGNGADKLGSEADFFRMDGFPGKTMAVDLGGGNDSAWIVLAERETTIIDGGAGMDVLTLDGNVSDVSTISGFENVVLVGDATVDFDSFSDVKTLTIQPQLNGEIEVLNLDDDIAVTFAGQGDIFIEYASESATITLGASKLGVIAAAGDLEDTLTLIATRAATVAEIDVTASTLVVKGSYSLNLGVVEVAGDDRTVDLSAVGKDAALIYTASQNVDHKVKLGGGDDALSISFNSKLSTTVTLGAGDDVVVIDGDSGNTVGAFDAAGALKTLTQITDFDPDGDTISMANQGGYHTLTAGFFIGVAETDEARFAKVRAEMAGQANVTFTAFEAADGSGVFIYGNDTAALPADDWYVKLTGVSLSDLRIDDDGVTGR